MTFSPGDLVQFKSGGETMTLEKVFDIGNVVYLTCVWIDRFRSTHRENFRPEVLMPAKIDA
jgi:uncharacterized protein YodC (DUF2158 family)